MNESPPHSPAPPHTLVTGATGFIGSVLVRQLVEAGQAVRIFRRPRSRLDLLRREGVAGAVEQVQGTLGEARSLRRALRGIRRVYHVAGRVGPGSGASHEELHRANARGTAHVVNAALSAGVERLLLTSSIAALGRPPAPPAAGEGKPTAARAVIDEAASWQHVQDPSPYARSKRAAELEVQRGIAEGLPGAVIVNPALVFGVGRAGEGTRRLVDLARRGRLWAAPPGCTCVADVEDVAAGHRRAMRLGATGQRYLLGGENLSWHAVFATLARAFGQAPPRFELPPALLKTAGTAAEALSFVTRRTPVFGRAMARSAVARTRYSARRAREDLGCHFRPFAETAARLADALAQA